MKFKESVIEKKKKFMMYNLNKKLLLTNTINLHFFINL